LDVGVRTDLDLIFEELEGLFGSSGFLSDWILLFSNQIAESPASVSSGIEHKRTTIMSSSDHLIFRGEKEIVKRKEGNFDDLKIAWRASRNIDEGY